MFERRNDSTARSDESRNKLVKNIYGLKSFRVLTLLTCCALPFGGLAVPAYAQLTNNASVTGSPTAGDLTPATATATVDVLNFIQAVNDDFSADPILTTGGTTSSVFAGDNYQGATPTSTNVDVSLTDLGGLTGATINADGTIDVPAGTTAGTYTLTYKICEAGATTNCDTATVMIEVEADPRDTLTPFSCPTGFFQAYTTSGQLTKFDLINGGFTPIGSGSGGSLGPVGYRVSDNLVYAMRRPPSGGNFDTLVAVDSTGTVAELGNVTSLPSSSYNAGDIDGNGYLLARQTATTSGPIYKIDVDNRKVVGTLSLSPGIAGAFADMAYDAVDNLIYTVPTGSTRLHSIDPVTGATALVANLDIIDTGFGAMFTDANGDFFAMSNSTGKVYHINKQTGHATHVGTGGAASTNDGFSCTGSVATLGIDSSDAPSGLGDASHGVNLSLRLGELIDADLGSLASNDASGDGADDDGVTIPTLTQGESAAITVAATGAGGFLQGWIDFNGDGDFDDAGEQVATNLQLASGTTGTINVPIDVPADAVTTQTFARFRWSTTSGLNATDAASNGEVEDYAVTIETLTPIDAVDDDFTATPILTIGGTTASVFADDDFDGDLPTDTTVDVSLTDLGGLTGATINADGTIDVPAGAAAGPYTLTYQICEAGSTTNCDTATVMVEIESAVYWDAEALALCPVNTTTIPVTIIQNPSFESYDSCPNFSTAGTISKATGWTDAHPTGGQLMINDSPTCVSNAPGTGVWGPNALPGGIDGIGWLGGHNVGVNAGEGATNTLLTPLLPGDTYVGHFGLTHTNAGPYTGSGKLAFFGSDDPNAGSINTTKLTAANSEALYVSGNSSDLLEWDRQTFSLAPTQQWDYLRVEARPGSGTSYIYFDDFQMFECRAGRDFSDALIDGSTAPDGTSSTTYGIANHAIDASLSLGSSNTLDTSAVVDADNGADDGITIPTLTAGETADVTIAAADITGTGSGTLHAWIDFNGNGSFEPTEYASTAFSNGASSDLTFSGYGTTAAEGTTYARFRLTSDSLTSANFATAASDGEVEDYAVTIETLTPIDAVDDDFTATPILTIGGTTASVFADDDFDGELPTDTTVDVTLTDLGGLIGATIDANGAIFVPAGTDADTYTLTYQICEAGGTTNCDTATVTIVVEAPAISPSYPVTPQAISICSVEDVLYEELFDLRTNAGWLDPRNGQNGLNPPVGFDTATNNLRNVAGTQTDVTIDPLLNGGSGVASPSGGSFVSAFDNAGNPAYWTNNANLGDLSAALGGAIYIEKWNWRQDVTASDIPNQAQDFAIFGTTGRLFYNGPDNTAALAAGEWETVQARLEPGPNWAFMEDAGQGTLRRRVAKNGTIRAATAQDFEDVLANVIRVGSQIEGIAAYAAGDVDPDSLAERYALDTVRIASCVDLGADFSDAPTSTLGGASHSIIPDFYLGSGVSPDTADFNSANADGDDDDGITIPTLTQGATATITADVTGAGGFLQGWIDFNGDGTFQVDEQVATDLQDDNNDGTISFDVPVPLSASTTQTFARFRWSTTSGLNTTDTASDGEVEDYALTISASAPRPLSCSIAQSVSENFAPPRTINASCIADVGLTSDGSTANPGYCPANPPSDYEISYAYSLPVDDRMQGLTVWANDGGVFTDGELRSFDLEVDYTDNSGVPATLNMTNVNIGDTTSLNDPRPVTFMEGGEAVSLLDVTEVRISNLSGTSTSISFRELQGVCGDDFSDAPASYAAASHSFDPQTTLGTANTQELTASNGDDDAGDDGITIPTLTQGATATITADVSGAGGFLQGWIDFNGDDDFDDAGEQVATDLQLASGTSGTINVPIDVPEDAVTTQTFTRFRWSTTSGLNAVAAASDGEVEDHPVTIEIGETIDAVVETFPNTAPGETTSESIFDSDLLNDVAVTPASVDLTVDEILGPAAEVSTAISVDADGLIVIGANAPAGSYTIEYTICETGSTTLCATATETIIVSDAPSLSIAKVLDDNADEDESETVTSGDTLTYTITATNNGNVELTNVVVTDPLLAEPNDTITCASVAVGESCELTGTHIVTEDEGAAGTVDNTATASSIEVTTEVTAELSTPAAPSPAPSLAMTKVADNEGPYTAGDVITYTYTVTNNGNQIIRDIAINDTHNGSDPAPTPGNETLLTDAAPTGDSTDTAPNGNWEVLAPGDTVTFVGTYTVTETDVENLR